MSEREYLKLKFNHKSRFLEANKWDLDVELPEGEQTFEKMDVLDITNYVEGQDVKPFVRNVMVTFVNDEAYCKRNDLIAARLSTP